MELQGQVAVITGGARGIGAATALELARHGVDISFCDLCSPTQAQPVIQQIEQIGRKALFFQANVAHRPAIERLMEQTVSTLGRVDILVNNAATSIRKPLLNLEVSDVETVWNVILWGAFHCSQLAARQMVKQGSGGSIVMISSVHAQRAFPQSTAYNGAKAGVNQMALTWAGELAPQRIRVNVIEPGWIDTPGERAFSSEEVLQAEGLKLPLGRLGKPEDIARAVRFLVSGDGAYITGTILKVDGGVVLPR